MKKTFLFLLFAFSLSFCKAQYPAFMPEFHTFNSADDIRSHVAINGAVGLLRSIDTPNDSLGGFFQYNTLSVLADDNLNVFQPTGIATGRWLRMPLYSNSIADITGLIEAGNNVYIDGNGASGDPYIINAEDSDAFHTTNQISDSCFTILWPNGTMDTICISGLSTGGGAGGGPITEIRATDNYGQAWTITNPTGPITTLSLVLDTTKYSTRAWRQKGIDSVGSFLVASYGKNGSNDSTILTLNNGTRYAAIDNGGSGGTGPYWPLASGALSGVLTGQDTITSNVANQLHFKGTWTASANYQYHFEISPSLTARGTTSDNLIGLRIGPTLTNAGLAQTMIALDVAPTFAGPNTANTLAIRVAGHIWPAANNTWNIGAINTNFGGGYITNWHGTTATVGLGASSMLFNDENGKNMARLFSGSSTTNLGFVGFQVGSHTYITTSTNGPMVEAIGSVYHPLN